MLISSTIHSYIYYELHSQWHYYLWQTHFHIEPLILPLAQGNLYLMMKHGKAFYLLSSNRFHTNVSGEK